MTHREKANLVEKENPDICLARQAKLLHISRSSIYYQPSPVSQEDINLMNLIDEIYTKYPFYGSRRMEKELRRYHDIICNRKHVRRLMGQMGIEAIYPRQNTSLPNQRNETYKYLLHNLTISCPQSGLGHRYHLYQTKPWLRLFSGDHGLVFSLCHCLGAIRQSGK